MTRNPVGSIACANEQCSSRDGDGDSARPAPLPPGRGQRGGAGDPWLNSRMRSRLLNANESEQ